MKTTRPSLQMLQGLQRAAVFMGAVLVLVPGGACEKQCTGPLVQVGAGCPDTFDGHRESFPACPSWSTTQIAYFCDNLIAFRNSDPNFTICYYDPTSHQLVGAYQHTQVESFCGDQFSRIAGRTPYSSTMGCDITVDNVERVCTGSAPRDAGL